MPSDRAAAFIRATNRSTEPASHRARGAAMLFADGSSSASSACRSVNCSPAAMDTTESCCPRRRLVSSTTASVSVIVAPASLVVTEHEIGRHHLRDAGDRSRVLVRAGLDSRLSYLDGGLAMHRPHRAGQRFAKRTTVPAANDVAG